MYGGEKLEVAITKISPNGQVVISADIRRALCIGPSDKFLVIGEDEEASPWEPLSVERGFKEEDNTVTVFFPNTFIQTVPSGTDAQGILDTLSAMVSSTMPSVSVASKVMVAGRAPTPPLPSPARTAPSSRPQSTT